MNWTCLYLKALTFICSSIGERVYRYQLTTLINAKDKTIKKCIFSSNVAFNIQEWPFGLPFKMVKHRNDSWKSFGCRAPPPPVITLIPEESVGADTCLWKADWALCKCVVGFHDSQLKSIVSCAGVISPNLAHLKVMQNIFNHWPLFYCFFPSCFMQ